MYLLFIYGHGLWPIGLLLFLLLVWFWYQAYKAHQSGWIKKTIVDGKLITEEGPEKIPYRKIPQFWFGVAIIIFAIIIGLMIHSDYKS